MSLMAETLETFKPEIEIRPSAPVTLADTGLSLDLVVQLVVKTLHFSGELTGSELASRLGLTFPVIEPAIDDLILQHHCQIVGGTMVGRASYRYRITDSGRARAMLFLEDNHYVGVAPVPVADYCRYMSEFRASRSAKATRARIRDAFAHLVLGDDVLDQLGPAINARHSMFVYGPPGNGKTVISQAIRNVLEGEIAVPHAIEVEGSIVRIFDPVIHEPIAQPDRGQQLDGLGRTDARWVICRRPMVTVGGELRLESLELCRNSGFYRAPIQTIANGGVLVIDDFGRQQCTPRELLNRWIVPLESRVDYLTLSSGQKIGLPFDVLVVFATNLQPSSLVDEAFLRRIQYKIYAQGPTRSEFALIFRNFCRDEAIEFDPAMVDHLIANWHETRNIPLRGCHPRDLIKQALAVAEYLERPRALTTDLLDRAGHGYFVHDESSVREAL
jgi:predicted ATPase with chaperone activity